MLPIKLWKFCVFLSALGSLLAAAEGQVPVAGHDRAVWLWQSPRSPYGSTSIIGNAGREDEAILNLKKWGITTVYGSYLSEGQGNATGLREWNRKLAANGIASYLLLSNTDYLFPETWPQASKIILTDFALFNKQSVEKERFAGLAFDIEPHILKESSYGIAWKQTDASGRRKYLDGLLNVYLRTRDLLNQNGEKDARIAISLPVWYSKLDGSIQWNNALDRDRWFTQLAQVCDRVSMMAFEISDPAVVLRRSQEEVDLLHGKARIALLANLGKEWSSTAEFWNGLQSVEAASRQSVDIQDYALLCEDEKTKNAAKAK